MKKRFVNLIAAIVAIFCGLFAFSACSKVEFKVNFVVDGAVYATLNTNGEEIIKMPENPTKDDYDFDGWYWDKDTWQTPFTANSLLDAPLSSDMNVYCKWKPKTVHVSGISLNKSEVSLHVDETEILTATITPANATDTSVLWESSNATIATVTGGKITALRVGSATITATANDGGQIASCEVYVTPIPVESVSLNYTQLSMLYGERKTLTASVTPQNATETGVIWQSSNAAVVAVENGKLTATGYGSAVITATTVDGGKTATCAVEVIDDTITFKTLQVAADGETVYGKVSNATETFSFLKEIEEHGNATYQVYKEITCETLLASKSISLNVGDNTVYILQTVGKDLKLYTVTVRRRPIYNVSFNSNGGTAVQSQQVEEDSFAAEPTTRRTGYTFARWTYDFSQAITQDTEIKAVWTANTDTKYKTEYYLQNLENDEYTLHETSNSQGTTDTTATAEIKDFAHFTHKATATDSGNIVPDGSLVLKVYYTRNKYNVRAVQNNEKGGTIANIDGKYKYGAKITLSATTNAGYTFNGFYDSEKLLTLETVYSFNADKDITITAKLSANTDTKYTTEYYLQNLENDEYTLLETSNLQGTTDTMATAEQKTYAHFTFNANTSTMQGNINGDGSLVLKAYYTRDKYNVVFEGNGGTLKSGKSNQILKYEGAAVAPAFTRTGYTFIGWNKTIPESVYENITITAQWKINQYTLTLIYKNGQPDKIITQDYKSTLEISNPERAGYGFIGWDKPIPKTMPAENITRTAQWNAIFKLSENGDTITGLTDYGKNKYTEIVIPAEIDGVKITSIGRSAFYNCSKLTSVTIGNSVTSIGEYAFYGCSGLTSVTIGNSVTSIGSSAFHNCGKLTSVTIGNSVTSIGGSAFKYCSNLANITIPNSVTSIGKSAFDGCSELVYNVKENLKYLGNSENPYLYLAGVTTSITEAKIDENCRFIGGSAFKYCSNLTSVTIGNSVTFIGDCAFYQCYGLKSIEIPDSVTFIGGYAFYHCSGLTSVTIPDNVTSIGEYAFYQCYGLKSIEIPNSVTTIGGSAFCDCRGLTSITIPNSVTSIGKYAFCDCSRLISVTISDSVTSIGDYAINSERDFQKTQQKTPNNIENSLQMIA